MKEQAKPEELKASKKQKVTYVSFNRENGEQVVHPNGKFLRYIREPLPGTHSSNDSDYHVVGVTEVQATNMGLTVMLTNGKQRIFPYSSISNFTVE